MVEPRTQTRADDSVSERALHRPEDGDGRSRGNRQPIGRGARRGVASGGLVVARPAEPAPELNPPVACAAPIRARPSVTSFTPGPLPLPPQRLAGWQGQTVGSRLGDQDSLNRWGAGSRQTVDGRPDAGLERRGAPPLRPGRQGPGQAEQQADARGESGECPDHVGLNRRCLARGLGRKKGKRGVIPLPNNPPSRPARLLVVGLLVVGAACAVAAKGGPIRGRAGAA